MIDGLTINIKLPREVVEWFDAQATRNFESPQSIIRRILIAHYRTETKQP